MNLPPRESNLKKKVSIKKKPIIPAIEKLGEEVPVKEVGILIPNSNDEANANNRNAEITFNFPSRKTMNI